MTELESGQYAAIVQRAKELGLPIDETEHPLTNGDEVIAAAKWLIDAAKEAHAEGSTHEAVQEILRLAGELPENEEAAPESEPSPLAEEKSEEPEKPTEPVSYKFHIQTKPKKTTATKPKVEITTTPQGSITPVETVPHPDQAENESTFMNLPIPKDWDGPHPDMPMDVTKLSDNDIGKLYSQFGFLLSRVSWLVGREKSRLVNAEHLRDYHFTAALAAQTDGTVDAKKAAANMNDDVVAWDKNIVEHKQNVHQLQAMRDVFSGNVERLSREWSMRTDTFNKEKNPT